MKLEIDATELLTKLDKAIASRSGDTYHEKQLGRDRAKAWAFLEAKRLLLARKLTQEQLEILARQVFPYTVLADHMHSDAMHQEFLRAFPITGRDILEHKATLDDPVRLTVMDEPGPGGAHHTYLVSVPASALPEDATRGGAEITMQKGPVQEVGFNGVSNEVLIAIVTDRLRSFQAGSHPCKENGVALAHFERGLEALHSRTRDRAAQGVEGTSQA